MSIYLVTLSEHARRPVEMWKSVSAIGAEDAACQFAWSLADINDCSEHEFDVVIETADGTSRQRFSVNVDWEPQFTVEPVALGDAGPEGSV